jgi:hypothetical protein
MSENSDEGTSAGRLIPLALTFSLNFPDAAAIQRESSEDCRNHQNGIEVLEDFLTVSRQPLTILPACTTFDR